MKDNEMTSTRARWVPVLVGMIALVPLVVHWHLFSGLFWFGDELALMEELNRMSFWTWLTRSFAENFVPVFKVAWGSVLFLGHGSYRAMLIAAWLTHAFNAWLLSRAMMRAGFGWRGTVLATAVFGLSGSNLETLTWGVQWSSELALTFFLLAAFEFLDHEASQLRAWSGWKLLVYSLAGAWSFSRGILIGPVILCLAISSARVGRGRRLIAATVCMIPSLVTAYLVARLAPENHHEMLTHPALWIKGISFSFWYFALNPFVQLWASHIQGWQLYSLHWGYLPVLAVVKLALIVGGFRLANPIQRRILWSVLLFDLGYAALLGFGRSGGDLFLAASSRYQYNSLACTMPFVAPVIDAWVRGAKRWRRFQLATVPVLIIAAGWAAESGWGIELPAWVDSRGLCTRRLLQNDPNPNGHDVVALPYANSFLELLAKRFNLH